MNAPMIEQMQQALQTPQQEVAPAPQQEVAPAPAPQQQEITPEHIAEAKRILGLDVLEADIKYQKSLAEVMKKYPDVSEDKINAELAELAKTNPELANQMRTDPQGMEILAAKIKASMTPPTKPDPISDTGANNGQADQLEERVLSGKATDIEVGKFLGRFKK